MYEPSMTKMEDPKIFNSTKEIEDLAMQFEVGILPKGLWTHQAHLAVALWYLLHYSKEEATRRMHDGIFKYNVAVGGKNTDHSGYHETITVFYMHALNQFLRNAGRSLSWRSLVNDLMDSKYADKNFPFEYYTREYLMSAQARKEWIAPDRKKLD